MIRAFSPASRPRPPGTLSPRPPGPCSGPSASSASGQAACCCSWACCGPSRPMPGGHPDVTRITSPETCTTSPWSRRRRRAAGPQSWCPSPRMRRPCAARWWRGPRHHLRTPRRKARRAAPRGLPCLGARPPRLRPATRVSSPPLLPAPERQCQLVQATVGGQERPLTGPESRDSA